MTSIGNDEDDDVVMTTTMNNMVGDNDEIDDDDDDDNGRQHHPPPNKKRRSSIDTEVLNQFKGLSANANASTSTTTRSTVTQTAGVDRVGVDGPPPAGSGANNSSTLNIMSSYYGNATMGSINDFNYTTEHTVTLKKPRTYISRLVTKFKSSLVKLHARNISDWKLECMSIFIHDCMSNISRNYHSVEHVFDICDELNKDQDKDNEQEQGSTTTTSSPQEYYYEAIGVLSALFHDCIYTNVDGGLTQNQMDVLGK